MTMSGGTIGNDPLDAAAEALIDHEGLLVQDEPLEPDDASPLDPPLPPKRKGGRKPVSSVTAPGTRLLPGTSKTKAYSFRDLRHVRRAQAAQQAGAGGFQRATYRVHQTNGNHNEGKRGNAGTPSSGKQGDDRPMPYAQVQDFALGGVA